MVRIIGFQAMMLDRKHRQAPTQAISIGILPQPKRPVYFSRIEG